MNSKRLTMVLAILSCTASAAAAQTPGFAVELPTEASATPGALTPSQLDQLVAPIALYPDQVLTDILAASTYPAQIVEAARFAAAHDGLQGASLVEAGAAHDWEPSVQALLAFPPVLHMLDGNLEWTDRLGRAFMAQQGDVVDAIQRLRLEAERAGTLQNGPAASVVNDGGAISINPPSPQSIYLPSYDAGCVYGGAGCAGAVSAVGWNDDVFLPFGFAQWAVLDWGHRCIRQFREGGGDRLGGFARSGARRGMDAAPGGVWRHAGAQGFSRPIATRAAESYAYAPPAGTMRPGYGLPAPALTQAHFAQPGTPHFGGVGPGSPMARAPAQAAQATHAGSAPGAGFGGRR